MKKLFFLSIVSVFTLSSFTTSNKVENKNPSEKRTWAVYCNGTYTGTISCDCTANQAQNAGNAMCN